MGVHGRIETSHGVDCRGSYSNSLIQAGGPGPAPVEPEAAGKPP
jgi:hypothetical protein